MDISIKNNKRNIALIDSRGRYITYDKLSEIISIISENFEENGIVSKEQMLSTNIPLMPLEFMINNNDSENKISVYTSGSTGKIFEVEWNKNDYLKSIYELWLLRYKYYGIKTSDKMCYFFSDSAYSDNGERRYNNTFGFSKINITDEKLFEIYNKMREFEPTWLLLQPSIAGAIINLIRKYKLDTIHSVRYIEFSGEMLDISLRKDVKDIFKCKVANQYGSYEFNSIAYECPEGNMHVMGSNVYVEIDNDDDLIITSLTNYRNPFVKYRIGDKGKILGKDIKCKCGNCNDILILKNGRTHEFITGEKGEKINSYIFMNAMMRVNEELDDIVKQFQVIQTDINKFDVRLYLTINNKIDIAKKIFEKSIEEKTLVNAEYRYIIEEGYIKEQDDSKLMFFKNILYRQGE